MRRALAGAQAVRRALLADESIAALLLPREGGDPELAHLAAARGVPVWWGSAGDLRRMGRGEEPDDALACLGPPATCDLAELLVRNGPVWLLADAAYPSNVGFAIRTAEVSGAAGVLVEAAFDREGRRRAEHVSMGAHRLLPVLWTESEPAIDGARAAGRRIVALDDADGARPEDVDLRGPVLLVVGGERRGLPPRLRERADAVVRLPMGGFVPSYNVQAAIAMLVAEWLRQTGGAPQPG